MFKLGDLKIPLSALLNYAMVELFNYPVTLTFIFCVDIMTINPYSCKINSFLFWYQARGIIGEMSWYNDTFQRQRL